MIIVNNQSIRTYEHKRHHTKNNRMISPKYYVLNYNCKKRINEKSADYIFHVYFKKFEPFVNVLLKAQTYYDVKDAEEYESVQGIYIALIMQYATFISTIPKDIVGHFWKESDDRYIFTVGTKKVVIFHFLKRINNNRKEA